MRKGRWQLGVIGMLVVAVATTGGIAYAESSTSSSNHYEASQLQFGSSDANQTCSGQYCSTSSAGGISTGDSDSSSYHAQFGKITTSDPLLEVIVDNGEHDLGVFSTSKAATKVMTVKVRNYLSSGYMMQISGTPPSHAGHTLTALSSPTTSQPGTEQFGINVVANTTPLLGKDPVQVPSGDFSFGVVAPNYAIANKFMYHNGDVIANSTKESGETDYTISMIVNIAGNTPAGKYKSDFSAVVIPIY